MLLMYVLLWMPKPYCAAASLKNALLHGAVSSCWMPLVRAAPAGVFGTAAGHGHDVPPLPHLCKRSMLQEEDNHTYIGGG